MTLHAERIKLSTTRTPVWSAVVAAVLSLRIAAVQPAATLSSDALPPEHAAVGVVTFAAPVLMILRAAAAACGRGDRVFVINRRDP